MPGQTVAVVPSNWVRLNPANSLLQVAFTEARMLIATILSEFQTFGSI